MGSPSCSIALLSVFYQLGLPAGQGEEAAGAQHVLLRLVSFPSCMRSINGGLGFSPKPVPLSLFCFGDGGKACLPPARSWLPVSCGSSTSDRTRQVLLEARSAAPKQKKCPSKNAFPRPRGELTLCAVRPAAGAAAAGFGGRAGGREEEAGRRAQNWSFVHRKGCGSWSARGSPCPPRKPTGSPSAIASPEPGSPRERLCHPEGAPVPLPGGSWKASLPPCPGNSFFLTLCGQNAAPSCTSPRCLQHLQPRPAALGPPGASRCDTTRIVCWETTDPQHPE